DLRKSGGGPLEARDAALADRDSSEALPDDGVVMFLPLATIWFLDYRASVDHLSRDIEERRSGQADAAVSYVNVWMDANLRMLRQNARLQDIVSMDPAKQA